MNRNYLLALVMAGVLVLTGCSSSGDSDDSPTNTVDTTAPTAVATPASDSEINGTTEIQVQFSESMDTGSVVMDGTLTVEAGPGVWSQTNSINDTLTIVPLTEWISGSGKTLLIDANDLAGNPLSQLFLTYDVDNTAPTANATPATASTIGGNDQVVITFNESIKPDSLVLGGTMASESDGGIWSTTTHANDILTVSPSASWSGGSKTLTVNATDPAGNAMTELALSYTVDMALASGTVSPVNGSALGIDHSITIVFTKAMNPVTLSLGGTLPAEAGTPAWSTSTYLDDTLVITPATQWSVGEFKTLTVDIEDIVGNAINTIFLTYDSGILFVAAYTGNDNYSGSRLSPFRTIATALVHTSYPEVYIQKGLYPETITLTSARTIKGDYDINWEIYQDSTNTIIEGTAAGSIIIDGVTSDINISGLEVHGVVPTATSGSSYAVRVLNSPGPVRFEGVTIISGNGAYGLSGTSGISINTSAASGVSGENADSYSTTCDDSSYGAGGSNVGGGALASGSGGHGGTMDTECTSNILTINYDATAGTAGFDAASGIGSGGAGGGPCLEGRVGGKGLDGPNGLNGSGGAGGSIVSGLWVPEAGGTGTLGSNGGGGGGGGGSGGCDSGTDSYGAGGGSGGAGGERAPTTGIGGRGGGASFGMLIIDSSADLVNVDFTLGRGGNGGSGGAMGSGQPGGSGGQGGQAAGGGASGGNGAAGGSGGNSGTGGGGAGGDVYGFYQSGSTVTVIEGSYTGGVAGSGGSSPVNSGTDGTVLQHN